MWRLARVHFIRFFMEAFKRSIFTAKSFKASGMGVSSWGFMPVTRIGRLGKRGLLCALALLLAPWLIGAAPGVNQIAYPAGPGRADEATERLVRSIFEYTRWPSRSDPVRICVVGPARYAERLGSNGLLDGRRIDVRAVDSDAYAVLPACDALYLGDIGVEKVRRWAAGARGKPVVTIAEDDPPCSGEAMFCLIHRRNTLSFQLNVDAVARSSVRIDPRVFRLSREQ